MNKKTLIWVYAVEALAALLIYMASYMHGGDKFLQFSEKIVDEIPVPAGVFLAIVAAAWLYWGAVQRSEFGKYLNWKKADGIYTAAYSYQITVFVIVLTISCMGKFLPIWGKHVLCILFLYGLCNMWTIIRNTWWLMKLSSKFQTELNSNGHEMER